jgi:CRISPR-associated endonuclease/helicase Cas3
LERAVELANWLHDLGKATDQFQAMIGGRPELEPLLCHETVSGLIARLPWFRIWLESNLGLDVLYPALFAAVGHHRRFSRDRCVPRMAPPLRILVEHDDFQGILREMALSMGLSSPPRHVSGLTLGPEGDEACDVTAEWAVSELLKDTAFFAEVLEASSPDDSRFVALVKTFSIAANVCASALARCGLRGDQGEMGSFVQGNLSVGLSPRDFDQLVGRWAWEHVDHGIDVGDRVEGYPPGFQTYPFQDAVARSDSQLTLAVAGSGSGKSLAAYLWGQRWSRTWEEEGRSGFRFLVALPTTGTTTEHFQDYALDRGLASPLKSRSPSRPLAGLTFVAEEVAPQEEVEVEDGEGPSDQTRQAEPILAAERDKIEALDLWGTPLVVSTADTVLGLMGNARRSVYHFPALVQSAIVFDEIHAYDDPLFSHLLAFLEHCPRIPVLLMAASLPEGRLQAIERVRPDLAIVSGPPELASKPRYEIPRVLSAEAVEDEVWAEVRACLNDPARGKVLWVRNQVDWATQTYQRCLRELPEFAHSIGLYHTRFRHQDRVRIHGRVIDAFRKARSPFLLIATQVAEMSPSLSADLLVTDLAPIPTLIQRFGRLNRSRCPKPSPSGRSIVLEPPVAPTSGAPDPRPYNAKELDEARAWLHTLIGMSRRLSQRDLIRVFHDSRPEQTPDLEGARRRATFLDSLWQTYPASTCGDRTTLAVVLQSDYERFLGECRNDLAFRRAWLREHEVRIPIRSEIQTWDVLGHTPIAPTEAIAYGSIDDNDPTQRTGAAWRDRSSTD